ncbi:MULTISPECIES: NAD(P)-dependent oxidoreductase [unclassified Marinobacter]|uniref:NAD(P)-dependent oxidoreductase n=1 Tax=unclassified Marinobacter TaxID=83889 RepID=UPI0026E16BA5|nr:MULTISPECIES: NAD(P)-dependent oxidoreductase [unclassified Marinobacter]MDO6442157.1 NAD(P)-dependent oxidoreductase [Marinobacter sp. 2_MG-2023]MDO6825077.1 NAD(P)-dependent oxidoreductase [Marinobacter sp. 1_MG-2023]
MTTATFIGLGVMGYPMAGHLAKAGLTVRVWNRSAQKSEQWAKEYPGTACQTIAEAVKGADFVMTCVGADKDLIAVYEGEDGILAHARSGAILVDHTTASAGVAERLANSAQKAGMAFIDAPVSGGQQGAQNGQLTIMCGGSEPDYAKAEPLLQHYSKALNLMGPAGSGQKTKMVNQIAIAGLVQGLSEALHFAEQANLDVKKVVDVISKGAAQSWQMENRSGTMIDGEFDHGFAVDWMRKDLGICLDEARKINASLPVTALVDQFYGDVQEMGGKRWDTSSLIQRLRKFR